MCNGLCVVLSAANFSRQHSGSLQDVGLWLETDWYRKQAVIKEIKKDSYAFEDTDVQVRMCFRERSIASAADVK